MEALAALAISLAGPYLAKGAEAFAQAAGTQAAGGVGAVVERLRAWWSGEPVAAAAAESLPADPQRYASILSGLLASDLARDPAFASELKALTERVGPHVDVIQRIEVADGVTGADIEELAGGSVHVEQHMQQASGTTGFKAKHVW